MINSCPVLHLGMNEITVGLTCQIFNVHISYSIHTSMTQQKNKILIFLLYCPDSLIPGENQGELREQGPASYHEKVDYKYICSFCSKGFRFASTREIHERIHTGEKPYKCGICSYSTTQKNNMKTHLVSHSRGTTHLPKTHTVKA